jgi:hypothetical protein
MVEEAAHVQIKVAVFQAGVTMKHVGDVIGNPIKLLL